MCICKWFARNIKKEWHPLPKDSRTLLKTPRTTHVIEKCGGTFLHFGIQEGIEKCMLENLEYFDNNDSIDLHINVDGLSLFKSTGIQIWPILGNFGCLDVFIISLFSGKNKPDSMHEFLSEFIAEFQNLAGTIKINEKHFSLSLKNFVCDAPARSFLKCIVNHTGYYSYERCKIVGTYV